MKRIVGRPIVFDSRSVNLGGFVEIIRSSAVDRLLRERADVVALKNHNADFPLGRVSAGTLTLRKDSSGLLVDIAADETVGYVNDVLTVITRGDARGGSFAFTALDDVWSLSDGQPLREVIDMSVREVSVGVTFPAYTNTSLSVRAQGVEAPRGRSVAMAEREMRLMRAR